MNEFLRYNRFMRNFRLHGFFSVLLILAASAFVSCSSAKVGPKTTFVNTNVGADGTAWTTCVFSSVTQVRVAEVSGINSYSAFEGGGGRTLEVAAYSYDPETGRISIFGLDSSKRYAVHVEGTYKSPAVFVLAENECKNPLVMVEGRRAVPGTDYEYDASSSKVRMKIPLDLDGSSFEICWFSSQKDSAFANRAEAFRAEYDGIIREWLSEQN